MCGRFAASSKPEDIVELFDVEYWDPEETLDPNWNVAPTNSAFVVLERLSKERPRPLRQLRALRWGLVPPWSDTAGTAVKMINARSDTVHEKPAYRQAFASRRCVLPVDGYYEWQTVPGERGKARKKPFFVSRADGGPLALAGLYEFWRDRAVPPQHPQAWLVTFTIVTTDAEEALAPIHERMPLFLDRESWGEWLDPRPSDPDRLRRLLIPPPPGALLATPVSPAVGSIRNNGPELKEPWVETEYETTLF
jgi:putative SOS response-associated peptidase YedK